MTERERIAIVSLAEHALEAWLATTLPETSRERWPILDARDALAAVAAVVAHPRPVPCACRAVLLMDAQS